MFAPSAVQAATQLDALLDLPLSTERERWSVSGSWDATEGKAIQLERLWPLFTINPRLAEHYGKIKDNPLIG